MNKVVCFGEVLIDFLNAGEHAAGPINISHFHQYPGGAPANAAVAVARLGGQALFCGQVGDDPFGRFLRDSLEHYAVDTRFLLTHPHAKTALAFVMLDDSGERHFSFYREHTADMVFRADEIDPLMFSEACLLHFCSNTLTGTAITHTTEEVVRMAAGYDCLISFDVNLRHMLWPAGEVEHEVVNQFVRCADIVKFSRDELLYLAQEGVADYIRHCLVAGCKLLIVTDGGNAVEYFTPALTGTLQVPQVKVVDTTAAGDAFVGGLLYVLSHNTNLNEILQDPEHLEKALAFAARCGAHAVTAAGAFVSLPQMEDVKAWLPNDNCR